MAYVHQPYNVNKNGNYISDNNGNVYTQDLNGNNNNNNTNNRRVQFYESKNKALEASNKSIPMLHDIKHMEANKSIPNPNPLTSQDSMPYRPEMDVNRISTPLKLNVNGAKSIELNHRKSPTTSNQSSPESLTDEQPHPSSNQFDHAHSQYIHMANNRLPINESASILVLKHNNLENTGSHKLDGGDSGDLFGPYPENGLWPVSEFVNNNVYDKKYNYKSQQYYHQDTSTMSNASYDHIPGLYAETSEIGPNEILPHYANTSSITFNKYDDETKEEHPNKRILSLVDFSNDAKCYETWMACCDIQDDTFGYYSALYPLLCEIFAENTNCCRVPKQSDLEEVILKHGAIKRDILGFNIDNKLSGNIHSDIIDENEDDIEITPPPTPNDKYFAQVNTKEEKKKTYFRNNLV